VEQKKINILVFSPSARKVWTDPKKSLNHVYWMMAYLCAKLSTKHNIYTIEKSFSPKLEMKRYNNEKIDMVLSIGASYNPGTLNVEFKEGFARHDRAFEIGYITKRVFSNYNPIHVNMNTDVRMWFDSLTKTFGKSPDIFITEQEMKWQAIAYYLNKKLKPRKTIKKDVFFFAGGVKKRGVDFLRYTKTIKLKKIIHGGGWEKLLKISDGYELHGFTAYIDSLKIQFMSKYGLVLHEPIGNKVGWITSKFFEYLGTDTVCFIAREYDKKEMYIPKDYILRVDNSEDINNLIETLGYDNLLKEQKKLINKDWLDYTNFYEKPFFDKINSIWAEQKK